MATINDDAAVSTARETFDTYESMKLQRETRGSILKRHLQFYTKYMGGIFPILAENLSEIPPGHRVCGVSRCHAIPLRAILFLRALLRSNSILTSAAKGQMGRLLRDVAAHNQPAQDEPLPVWRWGEDGGADAFYARWVRRPHPVIIKGLAVPARRWTVEGLIDRFGAMPVIFSDAAERHFEAPLAHLREQPEHYVHNCGRLFVDHPELMDDVPLHLLEPYMQCRGPVGQLFIGNQRGTGTRFHCAGNFNLFFQFEGRKRWWFVDPNHTFLLYPWLSTDNTYQASLIGVPRDPDVDEQFPLFRYCPRLTADLEPGDVLLNPPWWYHAIDNLTDATLAMATRWFPPDMVDTHRLYSCLHTEPRFMLFILRKLLVARKKGDRPNAWLIFEDTAHDESVKTSALPSSREVWGL